MNNHAYALPPLRERPSLLKSLAVFVWCATLVLHGTHFRESVRSAQGNPMVDWLILLKVAAAGMGILLGLFFIFKTRVSGIGGRILWAYIVFAAASSLYSDYSAYVLGYSILLAGGLLLIMGWMRNASSLDDVLKLEGWLFFLVAAMLLKDSLLGLVLNEGDEKGWSGRLGYGVVHPNSIGAAAASVFWLSMRGETGRRRLAYNLLRCLCILLILLSRSRTVMVAFAISAVFWMWFRNSGGHVSRAKLRNALLLGTVGGLLAMALLVSLDVGWSRDLLSAFNRGQELREVKTMTRRTEIWEIAFNTAIETPEQLAFGHGYAVSRLVLRDQPEMRHIYEAPFTHNGFLEFFLNMGLFGACVYFAMVGYGSLYFFQFQRIRDPRARRFAHRIIPLWVGILIGSLTESTLGTTMNSGILLTAMFMLLLDRKDILFAPPPPAATPAIGRRP